VALVFVDGEWGKARSGVNQDSTQNKQGLDPLGMTAAINQVQRDIINIQRLHAERIDNV
jgi:hypothetical protein